VQVGDATWRLVVAIHESTAEVKYFVTNALDASLATVLAVAFRRATIEHSFRLGKQEVGLMHFEGRHYRALVRHLILALIVLGFVAKHTERLRGKKSGGDAGAGVPGLERAVRTAVATPLRPIPDESSLLGDRLSSAA
jgi:SRSO17 transposase